MRAPGSLCRLLLFTSAVVGLYTAPADADEVADCVDAAKKAQDHLDGNHIRIAHAELLACSRPACPAPVKSFCAQKVVEVESSLPTIVVAIKDAEGHDVVDARVLVDGEPLADKLEGMALPVDPGPHVFRCEHAGSAPVEERVVIRQGEKNRLLLFTFSRNTPPAARDQPAGSAVLPTAGVPADGRPATAGSSSWPLGAFVLGGAGVVSLGAFAVLGITGQSVANECSSTGCASGTFHRLQLEQGIGWGALGAGVVSLGLATWLVLTRDGAAPRTAWWLPGSATGERGGVGTLVGRF
jgi:hypothetical protein